MTMATYNFKLEPELKEKAFAVIESFGLSPSQALRLFLKQTAETNKIPLSFDYERELRPTDTTLQAIAELEQGETTVYATLDDFTKAFAGTKSHETA